jgi:hypothetical protein
VLSDGTLKLFRGAAKNEKLWRSVQTYLDLRDKFPKLRERTLFEETYSAYYGIPAAFLSAEWRRRYFELLFHHRNVPATTPEPYRSLLMVLYEYPRLKGDKVLHFSFVSKLVAFHDESQPLYDERVRQFFGLGPPRFGSNEFKISGFVQNLNEIKSRYATWVQQAQFAKILHRMRERCPRLDDCHNVRLIDFLVHKAKSEAEAAP